MIRGYFLGGDGIGCRGGGFLKWFSDVLVNFFVRMVIGVLLIFLVNQVLVTYDIEKQVGINPVTAITAGTLGVPGVCLLYGMVFF